MRCKMLSVMTGTILTLAMVAQAGETNSNPVIVTVNVPGNANPWLAGAPDGTIAGANFDVAPNQSPMEITGVPADSAAVFTFSVTGGTANGPGFTLQGPDGIESSVVSRSPGAENGIGDLKAPMDALVGVFLDDETPGNSPPPGALDFGSASARDFSTLAPALRQPFFIGDGKTSDGTVQQFVPPAGAKRLFLGVMDGYEWANNPGSFTVKIAVVSRDH